MPRTRKRARTTKKPSAHPPIRPSAHELEPGAREMRRLVSDALDRIVTHIESLPRQKAADVEGAVELARAAREGLPETGRPYEELLDLLFDRLGPKSFNTAGPGLSRVHPRVAGCSSPPWPTSSATASTVTWVSGSRRRGSRSWKRTWSSGSAKSWAMVPMRGAFSPAAARWRFRRHRHCPPQSASGEFSPGNHLHLGPGPTIRSRRRRCWRAFPRPTPGKSPATGSIESAGPALERKIAEDRRAGFTPFLIVGNAGTTNTGAVDDLPRWATSLGGEKCGTTWTARTVASSC